MLRRLPPPPRRLRGIPRDPFAVPVHEAEGELGFRVPAFATTQGWDYAGQRIRVGTQFVFITNRYQLVGTLSNVPNVPLPTAAK